MSEAPNDSGNLQCMTNLTLKDFFAALAPPPTWEQIQAERGEDRSKTTGEIKAKLQYEFANDMLRERNMW